MNGQTTDYYHDQNHDHYHYQYQYHRRDGFVGVIEVIEGAIEIASEVGVGTYFVVDTERVIFANPPETILDPKTWVGLGDGGMEGCDIRYCDR